MCATPMRALARGFRLLLGVAACTAACRAPDTPPASVWAGHGPDFITGDISPDGRSLSDIDWATGDLQIVDLASGQTRRLTGEGYDAGGYAWTSAFSSDGRRLAVAWYRDDGNSHELRTVGADGTGARVLVTAGNGHVYIDPVDWTPADTEILVAIQTSDRIWQLALVSAETGTTRIVKTLGWQAPGGGHDQSYPDADVSPDGRYIAFDYPPAHAHTRDIYAVTLDGTQQSALVEGPGSDRLLGWLPDGSGILFYSDRGGSPAIWRQEVREGLPRGSPVLVRTGVTGLVPLGFVPGGYAYGVALENARVHVVDVTPDVGVRATPRPVADPGWAVSMAADWSPDGSRLAYVRHDPLPDPNETLVVIGPGGTTTRALPLTPALHTSNGTLRWSAEDRLFVFAYERGRDGIYEIDMPSGRFRRLPVPAWLGRQALKWFDTAPDGRTLYMVGPPTGAYRQRPLVVFDAATGEHRALGTADAIGTSLAVSPNGKQLALLARDHLASQVELQVLSTDGAGPRRTLHRAPLGTMSPPVAWMPDGSQVVVKFDAGSDRAGLWSVSVRGGTLVRLFPDCCVGNDVRIHPDGRRLAFVAGADRGEVRILKRF